MSRKLRPAPPPLEANDQLVTAVITAAWAIGLISALVLRQHLAPAQRWWVWTCAVGLCMGLFALWYVPRLKRARSRAAARRARDAAGGATQPDGGLPGSAQPDSALHDPALHDPALHDPALHDPALHDPAPPEDARPDGGPPGSLDGHY